MQLRQVPPELIERDDVWALVAPMLQKAIEHTRGARTLPGTRQQLTTRQAQLWAVIDDANKNTVLAAGVTSLQTFESGLKICNIELLGGSSMKEWFDLRNQLEDWSTKEGCKEAVIWARKGWAKHLRDYDLTHYILRKAL